jgi:hypothetical protein
MSSFVMLVAQLTVWTESQIVTVAGAISAKPQLLTMIFSLTPFDHTAGLPL